MLTELFVMEMQLQPDDSVAHQLSEHAEAFGAGLQLVNILKDITDDMKRGWCFVPRSLCRARGLRNRELLDPRRRIDAHRAVAPLFELARSNLDRGLNYALAVPAEYPEIRLFCLLPLWLAVKTVGLAYGNDALFAADQGVKITRGEVENVVARCTAAYDDDERLRADYEAMWTPVARLMVAGSAVEEWPRRLDAA
jgi:farnesyl-diphosphate farnesyltransferase